MTDFLLLAILLALIALFLTQRAILDALHTLAARGSSRRRWAKVERETE